MIEKMKNICISIGFCSIIVGLGIVNALTPDQAVSSSERRKLKQLPDISVHQLLEPDTYTEWDDYFLDQFACRDAFRTFKAVGTFYMLGLQDNNDIYLYNHSVYKMEYPLKEASIVSATRKLHTLYNKYLQELQVYYSIIPDKNYFSALPSGHLQLDYKKLLDVYTSNLTDMNYIDLWNLLDIDDYYSTDLHWKQEDLLPVANAVLTAMNPTFTGITDNYDRTQFYPFYGAYYGHSALPVKPDTITYLTNTLLNKAKVYHPITGEYTPVYTVNQLGSMDSYSVFANGPQPLLTIENPDSTSQKQLYLFRDSFSSSLSPLLLEAYRKITLIDLRYIASTELDKYISFEPGSDALFLYGIQVLNNSAMLKAPEY